MENMGAWECIRMHSRNNKKKPQLSRTFQAIKEISAELPLRVALEL